MRTLHPVRRTAVGLRGLLLDFDGTMAHTENGHRLACNRAFAELGLDWIWTPQVYAKLLGVTGGKERLRYYLAEYAPHVPARTDRSGLIDDIHRAKSRHFAAIAPAIPLRVGIQRLVYEAHFAQLRIAVVTSASRSAVEALLWQDSVLRPMIDLIAAGDVVERKKPAPDVYRWALARLNLAVDECVAIEDSHIGLRSALDAGLATIITVSPFTAGEDFSGAAAVVSELGDYDRGARSIWGPSPANGLVDLAFLSGLRSRS